MRTERQREILRKWIRAGCIGSAVCATGFGKTRLGLGAIKMFLDRNSKCRVIVVVPSDALRIQWEEQLSSYVGDITVKVINTAASVADRCDLLVLDEMHRYASDYFSRVFDVISYSYILGLTATLERLDGQHVLLESRAPVLDRVTLREALSNGWVSSCREYEVLIDVPDIDDYKALSKRFNAVFSFFDYDMNLVMSMVGKRGFDIKKSFANHKGCMISDVTNNVTLFMRLLQVRKQFIYNHPKKVEIADKIISKRLDKKIITFSNTVKMADCIGFGFTYSGPKSKKSLEHLKSFSESADGVMNTVKKVDEGLDVKGLSVAINLGIDSSKTRYVQRMGRVIRFEPGKIAEIFTIVIRGTAEEGWFKNSRSGGAGYTVISESELDSVLSYSVDEEFLL